MITDRGRINPIPRDEHVTALDSHDSSYTRIVFRRAKTSARNLWLAHAPV